LEQYVTGISCFLSWSFWLLIPRLCVHVDFMFQLLRYDPQERLGSGVNGVQELKAHPFFSGTDWEMVFSASATI